MFKGALIGIGIVALSVLPPMIHFVTGPVGPLIGGFVAGWSRSPTVSISVCILPRMRSYLIRHPHRMPFLSQHTPLLGVSSLPLGLTGCIRLAFWCD